MIKWLSKNREWVFSGIGVAIFSVLIGVLTQELKPSERKSSEATAGDNSIIIQSPDSQGTVTVNQSLVENLQKEVYPVVYLDRPIEEQVQLFATDIVKIDADPDMLKEVWFGDRWMPYDSEKEYIVWGEFDKPVTPKFKAEEGTRAKMRIEISVQYTENPDTPRDIRKSR